MLVLAVSGWGWGCVSMTESGRTPSPEKGPSSSCPPCDDPLGHQYDDDRTALLYEFPDGPWSNVGDPCIWCDHEKCEACPPPRGGTFAEEHAAGRERCWNEECSRCGTAAKAENERVRLALATLREEYGDA